VAICAPPARSYEFSPDRRRDLRDLGLIKEQIAELEKVLPSCRLGIEGGPRLQDVRGELREATKAIATAALLLRRLADATVRTPARFEALNRLQLACYEYAGDCNEIERARDAVETLALAAPKALVDLPKHARRPKSGSARPIELIHDALIRGWGVGGRGKAFNVELPRLRKKFQEIVDICYEPIGAKLDYSPEKAMRAFFKRLEARGGRLKALALSVAAVKEGRQSHLPERALSRLAGGRPNS